MRASVIFLLVPASLATYGGYLSYRLAWLHHQSRQALRHVDEQLSKHHELIPHLILAIANYAQNEREVLINVIHARKRSLAAKSMEERMAASTHLSQALHHLFRVSETSVAHRLDDEAALIHMEVVMAEQKIALAREYYNHIIQPYNERISSFPSSILARIFGFERKVAFEIPEHLGHSYAAMEFV